MKTTLGVFVAILASAIFAGTLCGQPATQPAASPASQPFGGRFTVGKDTTYILGPLAADGTVDYVAALDKEASEGVTPKNNAYVLILEALGVDSIGMDIRAKTLVRLGFGRGKEKFPDGGPNVVPLRDFLKSQSVTDFKAIDRTTSDLSEKAAKCPWRKADFPLLADWLMTNEKPLAKLVEASCRLRFYFPAVSPDKPGQSAMIYVMLPSLQQFMRVGEMFAARAMLRLSDGDLDGAWADLMADHRLGCLMCQSSLLITQMVGVYIRHQAFQGMRWVSSDNRLTAAQARKFLAELSVAAPDPKAFVRACRAERYFGLSCIEGVMTSPDPSSELSAVTGVLDEKRDPKKSPRRINLDWDEAMRMVNPVYDKIVDAAAKSNWRQRLAALEEWEEEFVRSEKGTPKINPIQLEVERLFNPKLAGRHLGELFRSILIPAVRMAAAQTAKRDEDWQLVQVALALAAHKAEKGKFPEKLADLSPAYIKAVPSDEFTGLPLKYSRTEAGYLLYSVGPNRIDDGGVEDLKAKPEKDDIAISVPLSPQPAAGTQRD